MHRNLIVGTLQSILRQAGVSLEDFFEAQQSIALIHRSRRPKCRDRAILMGMLTISQQVHSHKSLRQFA
jgi:hypothetical protein